MHKKFCRMALTGFGLAALSSPAVAQNSVTTLDTLPAPVKAVYLRVCQPDSWIGNKRILRGSMSKVFSDGARIFLMVCGDAAATVPFTAIVLYPTGKAAEAHFQWRLREKNLEAAFGDARFGTQPDTIMSRSHSSARCNPTYIHRWDGAGFQLVAYNGGGCDDGK